MRVTRILLILIVLCIAVPGGIVVYSIASQPSTTTQQPLTNLPQLSDAQLEQIAAAQGVDPEQLRQMMAQRGLPGGTFLNSANSAQAATSLALLGTVEANESAALAFQTSGKIAEVLVSEGDYVTAGTVLARIDAASAQRSVDDARLSLENVQLDLQTLLEPPSESDVEQARLGVVSAQASYSDAARSSSETQIQTAQLKLDQAQQTYDLEVQKRANMSGSEEELSLQDAAVGAASFNLEIARLNLQDLQTPDNQGSLWSAGINIQIAELNYEQALNGASASQITNAQLAVENAEVNLANAEATLAKTELVAPISGVITALNIEPGTTVSQATTAVEITDISTLWLTASLHELDLDQVSEGMSATVTFDSLPDVTFPATLTRIDWIGTETDGIVQYTIWFAVETDDSRILPGMTGEATLDLTQSL